MGGSAKRSKLKTLATGPSPARPALVRLARCGRPGGPSRFPLLPLHRLPAKLRPHVAAGTLPRLFFLLCLRPDGVPVRRTVRCAPFILPSRRL